MERLERLEERERKAQGQATVAIRRANRLLAAADAFQLADRTHANRK